MGDEASNHRLACETHHMAILIADLIRIGVSLGVDVAERVYLSLREEPRTAHGDRIDWTTIRQEILDRTS